MLVVLFVGLGCTGERGQAEEHAGVIGQAQAVGDALDDGELLDTAAPVEDFVDARLAQAGGGADADLAGAVFSGDPEKSGNVAAFEYFPGFVLIPDGIG
ncbi:hypothetical protein ACFQQB_25325 [Nonomuraea rubra]|uniref:hypothetical protein n=1 Tax=Nonomuraea rubra TaxID=46180 RepID=UPI0036106881